LQENTRRGVQPERRIWASKCKAEQRRAFHPFAVIERHRQRFEAERATLLPPTLAEFSKLSP